MSSTRNLPRSIVRLSLGALASAGMSFSTGCQKVQPPKPDVLNDEPLVVDEAMQIRDWDRRTAYYASGAVVAGSQRVTFEPKYETKLVEATNPETGETEIRQERTGDSRLNYVVDPALGLTNFVIIPFTYFWDWPFVEKTHRGTIIPPSHTAMPVTRVIE